MSAKSSPPSKISKNTIRTNWKNTYVDFQQQPLHKYLTYQQAKCDYQV